jgi:excisionase family DNA binding protein
VHPKSRPKPQIPEAQNGHSARATALDAADCGDGTRPESHCALLMSQLTTAEAAKMLGIAEATLNEWRIRGQGPAYTKMGRLVRYPEYEVQRYIRERTIETSYRKRSAGEEREMGVSFQLERTALFSGHRFRGRSRKHC